PSRSLITSVLGSGTGAAGATPAARAMNSPARPRAGGGVMGGDLGGLGRGSLPPRRTGRPADQGAARSPGPGAPRLGRRPPPRGARRLGGRRRRRYAGRRERRRRMDATAAARVVLVHDWLTGMRGGEKCLEVVCRRWPWARLYTLLHRPGAVSTAIERLGPRA